MRSATGGHPMKALLLAALVLVSTQVHAQDKTEEKEVAVGISGVYVPGHFDSSSDAYMVVNGIFPNGCYRWKRSEVINKDSFNHEITSYASVSQGMCLMVLVPFLYFILNLVSYLLFALRHHLVSVTSNEQHQCCAH